MISAINVPWPGEGHYDAIKSETPKVAAVSFLPGTPATLVIVNSARVNQNPADRRNDECRVLEVVSIFV